MIALLLFLFFAPSRASNLDYLDLGLDFSQVSDVYYWSSPVTVQLIYSIPKPPEVDDFTKPRCNYALSARKWLFQRFQKQFPHVAEYAVYKENCARFQNDSLYFEDNSDICYKCFHISSDSDPFYLECITLLDLQHICKKSDLIQKRFRRDTKDQYMLSNVAVMLAENAKMQDDRVTSKFRKEHHLQKENVNFQLLLLNSFRWKMSLSELWFLHYIESDPQLFAKILLHMSGMLPKTRELTESKINSSLSDTWKVTAMDRNMSHVTLNITFTAYHPEYEAKLYRFRFLPVKHEEFYFAIHFEDAYALQCGETVILATSFEAKQMTDNKYISENPCHRNHDSSSLQNCMREVINGMPNAAEPCLKNAIKVARVNPFYFTLEYLLWFPETTALSYNCPVTGKRDRQVLKANSLVNPQCDCFYSIQGKAIPSQHSCARVHVYKEVPSNAYLDKLGSGQSSPFFLGRIQNQSYDNWAASATNQLSERVLIESESVRDYFRKKLEDEAASTSGEFRFKFNLSSLWLILPVLGILFFGSVLCYKWRCNNGFTALPGPVFINHCEHRKDEQERIELRRGYGTEEPTARVVSWPAAEHHRV